MPANRFPLDLEPFANAFLPPAFQPDFLPQAFEQEGKAAETVELPAGAVAKTKAPFASNLEDDLEGFVFWTEADAEFSELDLPTSLMAGTGGASGSSAGSSPGSSGITLDHVHFSFARPDTTGDGGGGGGGGGKPPKDGGDTGDTGGLLTSYTSGGSAKSTYNITVNFEDGAWTAEIQQLFIDAAEYLSTVVLGDISDERVPLFGRVDDLAIDASIIEMDGVGGMLGGAAVFASRVGSALPAASIMQFDVADIDAALAEGYFYHVVLHEMVHAMGFGGKWADMGLVQAFMEEDATGNVNEVLRFTGTNATAEYNKLALADADAFSDRGVLVEMDGGAGTEDVHWDDETFTDFLMTGYIDTTNPGDPTLSTMTIAALEDMGYDTIYEPVSDALFV